MRTGDQVAEFLYKEGLVEVDESPWPERPEIGEGEELYEVDWDQLFPPSPLRKPQNEWDLEEQWMIEDDELISKLEEAIKRQVLPEDRSPWNWDNCAWYQPIHYYGYDWGIFIRQECIYDQAIFIANRIDPSILRGISSLKSSVA